MHPLPARTCVQAWMQACEHLAACTDSWRDYNVILEISDPYSMTESDHAVVKELDRFLRKHGGKPFDTVVNTIFPAKLHQLYGPSGVYERYMSEMFPRVKRHQDCSWGGTYAQRIIQRDVGERTIYPLRYLVDKIRSGLERKSRNRAAYEVGVVDLMLDIPIYDPSSDRHHPLGGPCLSHLSFNLSPPAEKQIYLTALYRQHYYVQRALGNLFGLAHLLHFVAQETGLQVGRLTCVSSVAQLELKGDAEGKWTKSEVEQLLRRCRDATGVKAA